MTADNDAYYNTTNLAGEQLRLEVNNAVSQEEEIIGYFKSFPFSGFTPFEIQSAVFSKNVPITSVRRAMTNLTNRNILIKTTEKRIGDYGKGCYCWKLKNNDN